MTVPKFKETKQRIEEMAPSKRLARTPFIASCAALYWLMSFPLFITSSLSAPLVATSLLSKAVNSCLKIAAFGLAVQIIGDTQKYIAKKRGGEATLVTGGLYRYLRHPNYTGELVLWTFSSLAGILAASSQKMTPRLALLASGSVLGSVGIAFILALAATGLEKRQYERYGKLPAYTSWVQGSIPGLLLPKKKPAAECDASSTDKARPVTGTMDIFNPRISNELEVEEGL
jgi:steroid 5-alpha reductase family enzyme